MMSDECKRMQETMKRKNDDNIIHPGLIRLNVVMAIPSLLLGIVMIILKMKAFYENLDHYYVSVCFDFTVIFQINELFTTLPSHWVDNFFPSQYYFGNASPRHYITECSTNDETESHPLCKYAAYI